MPRIKDLMGSGSSAGNARAIVGSVTAQAGSGVTQGTQTLPSETTIMTTAFLQSASTLPSPAQGSAPGDTLYVYAVAGASPVIYPDVGAAVNDGAANASIAIPAGKMAIFKRLSATLWGVVVTA